jgi:PAS domain S-box-containing protein
MRPIVNPTPAVRPLTSPEPVPGIWSAPGAAALNPEDARRVLENLGVGILVLEQDLRASTVNAAFERATGCKRKDLLGSTRWMELFEFRDGEDLSAGLRQTATDIEAQLRGRCGELMDVALRVTLIRGTLQWVVAVFDITARKTAERDLLALTAQMADVVNAIQGFLFTAGPERRVTYMNSALVQHLGPRAEEPTCHQALFGRDSPCDHCCMDRVRAGQTVKDEVWSPVDKRWYYMQHSPVTVEDQGVGAQVLMIDITEHKLTGESLKASEQQLRKENVLLRSSLRERYRFGEIIGKSAPMQRIYEMILNAAATDANVIIYGQSGTGKELVARAIHETSCRKPNSFVPVNCGAIPETLMESEFFGHRKGAFTGAVIDKHGFLDLAHGGTLFLDELGDIGHGMQVKLLRAIDGGGYTPLGGTQARVPDVRIIAATNRDILDQVRRGAVREDFFYRIHVIPIHLPPLRERREDIPLLVEHFVRKFGVSAAPPVTSRMLERLMAHDWPGNVRELQNTIYRYLTLKQLDFAGSVRRPADEASDACASDLVPACGGLDAMVEQCERQLILRALECNRWQREVTAEALGIHRKTLFTKMKRHGLVAKGV